MIPTCPVVAVAVVVLVPRLAVDILTPHAMLPPATTSTVTSVPSSSTAPPNRSAAATLSSQRVVNLSIDELLGLVRSVVQASGDRAQASSSSGSSSSAVTWSFPPGTSLTSPGMFPNYTVWILYSLACMRTRMVATRAHGRNACTAKSHGSTDMFT